MKNQIVQKTIFFIAFLTIFCVDSVYAQSAFNDALKQAKDNNKRVIVDVYTDWCGWCHKMDGEAYSNSEVKKIIADNFVFIKLNAEGNESITYNGKTYTAADLAAYFQAIGFPTTVFLEPDGKVIEFPYDGYKMNNLPGYFKTDDFKKILEYMRDAKYKDTDLSKIIS